MPVLRRASPLPPKAMSWAVVLGAMAPDLDIVSRVVTGRGSFFSGAWYAHRGASHSILGTFVLGLIVAALLYRPQVPQDTPRPWVAYAWLAGCAWAGGLLHIMGDLFTPGWQLPVLWPMAERFGAWKHIGWFTPYLLWLFLGAIALGTLASRGLGRFESTRRWAPVLTWAVYALATYRWVSFMAESRYTTWDAWIAYQKTLLPGPMITPFTAGLNLLWHWYTG
jgi:membrane-bound metal-dependent hydrolase YbcI (DUF457 family)